MIIVACSRAGPLKIPIISHTQDAGHQPNVFLIKYNNPDILKDRIIDPNISNEVSIFGVCDVPTELIFGFAEKFLKALPFVRQTVITAHPPETKINLHSDNEEFYKIHMPITANNESMFNFEGKEFFLFPEKFIL